MNSDCDVVLKIIIIGNSGVGKSALLKSFMGDIFQSGYTSTIGVDFEIKPVTVEDKTVNLQIWDTAGQERFRTITTSYYRSSDAVMLVFDVTERKSYQQLEAWLEDVRGYAREGVDVLLVGNKVDLDDKRQISYTTAKEYAEANGMLYVETSAKTSANVEEAFNTLASVAVEHKGKLETSKRESVNFGIDSKNMKSSGSCCGLIS